MASSKEKMKRKVVWYKQEVDRREARSNLESDRIILIPIKRPVEGRPNGIALRVYRNVGDGKIICTSQHRRLVIMKVRRGLLIRYGLSTTASLSLITVLSLALVAASSSVALAESATSS